MITKKEKVYRVIFIGKMKAEETKVKILVIGFLKKGYVCNSINT